MYNMTINDGYENHTITGVPDEVGKKILKDAFAAQKVAELYELKPGIICKYKESDGSNKKNWFVLTKVWFESVNEGYFNAIYVDGDVIQYGSLELIERESSLDSDVSKALKTFFNAFDRELGE